MRKLCPICRKRMSFNLDTKEWHCLPRKQPREKKSGCGYIWSPNSFIGFELPTEKQKEEILKSLGGKTK